MVSFQLHAHQLSPDHHQQHAQVCIQYKMRAGFLGSAAKPRPSNPGRSPSADSIPAAKPQEPSSNPSVQLSDEQWVRNFDQCLELLASPTDETRFVGLLLATKLLPQGGDEALRRVLQAVGWPFIKRLLLPLGVAARGEPSPPLTQEQLQQQVMCAGVGLSMVAGLCRLPEVGAGPELRQLLPSLAYVLKAGSVTGALEPISTSASQASGLADWPVIEEAFECLHAACNCSDTDLAQQTRQQLISAGVLDAVASLLTQLISSAPQHKWQAGVLGVPHVWRIPALAVTLVRDLTAALDHQAWQSDAVLAAGVKLIPSLGCLIGMPEVLDSAAASAAATVARKRTAQAAQQPAAGDQPQQQQEMSDQVQPSVAAADAVQADAALVQLQSLYALLFLLQHLTPWLSATTSPDVSHQLATLRSLAPAHHSPPASKPPGAARQLDVNLAGWGAAAARGLCWVLRGRVGLSIMHTALQTCCSLVEWLGPSWLIMHAPEQPSSPHLVKILSETLQVELGLLLRDALHEGERLPAGTTTPQPSAALLKELATRRDQSEQAADSLGPAGALSSAMKQQPSNQQQPTPPTAALTTMPAATSSTSTAQQGSQTAGQRASQLLPAVLSLLEQLIEVLAQQAQLDDGGMDEDEAAGMDVDTQPHPYASLPRIPLDLQQSLVLSLSCSIKLVVQFMRSVGELQGLLQPLPDNDTPQGTAGAGSGRLPAGSAQAAAAASVPPVEVRLACTRLVGRYIAEVPDAVDDDVLAVLPVMLSCTTPAGATAGGAADGDEAFPLQALGFLLPGLLQVSSTAVGTAATALRLSVQAPASAPVRECVCKYMAQAAQQAAAAAESSQAVDAERRLADVCMLCANLLGPVGEVLSDSQAAVVEAMQPAAQHIATWASQRVKQLGSAGPSGTGIQAVHAVLVRMSQAQLMPRALLCSAAWAALALQHSVQAGSQHVLPASEGLVMLMTGGVHVGFLLHVGCVMEEEQPGTLSRVGVAPTSHVNRGLDVLHLLDDVLGDGERCWDLLLCSTAALLPSLPCLHTECKRLVVELANPSQPSQQGVYQIAKGEVEAEHVAWQLLVSRL